MNPERRKRQMEQWLEQAVQYEAQGDYYRAWRAINIALEMEREINNMVDTKKDLRKAATC